MIRKFKDFILTFFRTIYLFEANNNKKKLKLKNFKLVIIRKFFSIKNEDLKKLIDSEKKKRFKKKKLSTCSLF